MNAMEARKMTNKAQNEAIAKMNEYANYQAEAICEEIAIAAKAGKASLEYAINGDLKDIDMRTRVNTILKNNGYFVKTMHNYIFIAW